MRLLLLILAILLMILRESAAEVVTGTCAEKCAEQFLQTMADHPEYTSQQFKASSLACINDCHDGKL
ncbi:unnamed protein product [Caenorhabditis auriculariae]|uniref:Uncharacterized protein n=1 Tax=Caenorhabditis auriculariae TaxID=2777116 RepID=A0A8S1HHV9_9PELO|nr:unnamed protein product [Caenorhabditis auriculariae]